MEFLIMVDIFPIFLHEVEIYCYDRLQKLSLQTNWIFCLWSYIILEQIA